MGERRAAVSEGQPCEHADALSTEKSNKVVSHLVYKNYKMADIPTETIERYLKELGFDDVSPELMEQLRKEIAKRMKDEEKGSAAKEPKRASATRTQSSFQPKRKLQQDEQRTEVKRNKYYQSDESS